MMLINTQLLIGRKLPNVKSFNFYQDPDMVNICIGNMVTEQIHESMNLMPIGNKLAHGNMTEHILNIWK